MKKLLKRLRLKAKLVLAVSILVTGIVVVQSFLSYQSLSIAYNTISATTMESLDSLIKTEVQSIVGVLTENYNRYKSGEITEDVALQNAKKIVRDTRYNGSGYFWADMADGKCIVHMNPDYEGKMRYDNKDSKGIYYIRNFIALGDKGGGFSDFWFTKPGKTGEFQKRGYTQKFEPYGWYISTGNYQEDMTPLIQKKLDECNRGKTAAMMILVISSIIFIILGILLISLFANSITKPLISVTKRLEQLSQGDLHTPVPTINSNDETGILARTTQSTITQLHESIADITNHLDKMADGNFSSDISYRYVQDFEPIGKALQKLTNSVSLAFSSIGEAANQVSGGSEQVSNISQALAQGASAQASAVEKLSVAIGEISLNVKDNAEHAAEASKNVNNVRSEIEISNQHMNELNNAISEINDSSSEIGKIIKTIEDIAFQTNILALNAAVEAARAGAAGKGFAVVADEVRNLASKSAEAAKNTTSLIENSMRQVENGTGIADQTAKSLLKVVDSVKIVSDSVEQISAASGQQANSISQVTTDVNQISDVVQNNSATAEEGAAASEELSGQAKVMKELVSRFKLRNNTSQRLNAEPQPQQSQYEEIYSDNSKYYLVNAAK